ncbi:hypothetical protein TI39_contig611g00008 [Zymoseptoria brevis]|uniref:Uncharacterized protein n=1 Tax=Zymoseptoria brevis TaxID=1047168 RepID=A0A0F4GH74_9PEZI|nr:hypothetical protein TI39_contig611g00008 [Zymoseptoria brevis]
MAKYSSSLFDLHLFASQHMTIYHPTIDSGSRLSFQQTSNKANTSPTARRPTHQMANPWTLKTYTCLHYTLVPNNTLILPRRNPSLILFPIRSIPIHRPSRNICPICQGRLFLTANPSHFNLADSTTIFQSETEIRAFFLHVLERYLFAGKTYFEIPALVRARFASDPEQREDVSFAIQHYEVERRDWASDPFFAAWQSGSDILQAIPSVIRDLDLWGEVGGLPQLVWDINAFLGEVSGILQRVKKVEDGVRFMEGRERLQLRLLRVEREGRERKMGEKERREKRLWRERTVLSRGAVENVGEVMWKGRVAGVERLGGEEEEEEEDQMEEAKAKK